MVIAAPCTAGTTGLSRDSCTIAADRGSADEFYSGRIDAKSEYLFSVINLRFLLAVTPLRIWCFRVGTEHGRTASVVLTTGLFFSTVFWMLKWLYAKPGRRLMDTRLAQ